jgi:tRNA dimethylallyltransferase
MTAARLAPADSQRIQRALEVWEISGQPLSAFHTPEKRASSAGSISAGGLFCLEPDDRAWLHARIAARFEAMLDQGFLEEVQRLRADPHNHADLPAMRCVGYRQAWQALDTQAASGGALDFAGLRERGVAATRQLAKRQITWLRSMPKRQRIACDQAGMQAVLEAAVLARLEQRAP